MICKSCGTQNDDGMKFCTHCGAEMNAPASEAPNNPPIGTMQSGSSAGEAAPKKKWPLKTRLAILLIAAVVGALVIGHSLTKPERAVTSYINAQVENSYSDLYDCMDIPKGDFTSEKQFVDTMKKSVGNTKVDKVKSITLSAATAQDVDDADLSDDYYFDKAYKVTYVTEYGIHNEKTVFLTKQGKTLLLFDKYRVAPIEYIAEQYEVSAPSYASVLFDGVKLDSGKYVDSKNSDGDSGSYSLSNVFIGKHSVTVTAPFLCDYTETINVKDGGNTTCSALKVKPEVSAEMQEMTKNALKLLFDSSKAGKSFSDISSNIKVSSTQPSEIESDYKDFFCDNEWSGFRNDGITYKTLELVDVKDADSNCCSASFDSKAPLSYVLELVVKYDVEATDGYMLMGDTSGERTFSYTISFSDDNNELSIYSIRP